MPKDNIFSHLPMDEGKEVFETLHEGDGIIIERIVSYGERTRQDEWYDQDKDEWVVLLQGHARLEWKDGSCMDLKTGDYLYIPAHKKHRVIETNSQPTCIWLAFHFKVSQ